MDGIGRKWTVLDQCGQNRPNWIEWTKVDWREKIILF